MPEPANSANRKARATSDTLSERLVAAWFATRSRPEWNDGDFGIPSGETARRGLLSAAANIAREGARAAGPAWTIAGGGRQRHPSGGPAAPGPVRAAVRGRTATRRSLPRLATCGAARARALPPHPAARPRGSHPSRSIQPPLGLPRHTVHDLHNVSTDCFCVTMNPQHIRVRLNSRLRLSLEHRCNGVTVFTGSNVAESVMQ